MFRDTEKELARLEAELLAEEPELTEEDLDKEPEAPNYHAYNTDITDEDLDEYCEAVQAPGKGRISLVLAFLLCLLTTGLVALVFLFLRQEGLV